MARGKQVPTSDELREQVRNAGLRVTEARMAVLAHLHESTSPQSHAEVADARTLKGTDRATVYRNLMDLTDAGLVRRSDVDHVWRFEVLRDATEHTTHGHAHFVCRECGDVQCLPREVFTVQVMGGVPRAILGGDCEIQLRGRCDRCA